MFLNMYSVFDTAAQAFLPPFYERTDGAALRSFMNACEDPKHMFARHSADYILYCVGTFDDSNGSIVVPSELRILARAKDIVAIDAKAEGTA